MAKEPRVGPVLESEWHGLHIHSGRGSTESIQDSSSVTSVDYLSMYTFSTWPPRRRCRLEAACYSFLRFLTNTSRYYSASLYSLTTKHKAVDDPSWQNWKDGSWQDIARNQAGQWMYLWISVVLIISNFGMFVSELMEDTWQLCGMAECGLAPKFFAKKSKTYGAPIVCCYFT